jgi:hypothetical protein
MRLAIVLAMGLLLGGASGTSAQKRAGSVSVGVTIVSSVTTRPEVAQSTPVRWVRGLVADTLSRATPAPTVSCGAVCRMAPARGDTTTVRAPVQTRMIIPDLPTMKAGNGTAG